MALQKQGAYDKYKNVSITTDNQRTQLVLMMLIQ